MKKLYLHKRGDYWIKDTQAMPDSYCVGDYLEVELLEQPRWTLEKIPYGDHSVDKPVCNFKLRVHFSAQSEPFDCTLSVVDGYARKIWDRFLRINYSVSVKTKHYRTSFHEWYYPVVDGNCVEDLGSDCK